MGINNISVVSTVIDIYNLYTQRIPFLKMQITHFYGKVKFTVTHYELRHAVCQYKLLFYYDNNIK